MKTTRLYRAGCRDRHYAHDRTKLFYVPHLGAVIPVHSAPPPPVAKYEEWLEANGKGHKRAHGDTVTGRKLRQAVIAIRNGESRGSAARIVGINGAWITKLPPELAA